MAKNKGKKIILFLVEGYSDYISLEFVDKLNENETIKFCTTGGDITSNDKVNTQNCIKKINECVLSFAKTNKLLKSDIIKIIHIIDTDGVYIPNNKILEDINANNFIYTTEGIIANSKDEVIERNKKKKEVLEKLLSTYNINSTKYKVYYMSCNLEHVLHNELKNFSDEEKKKMSNEFADRFYENEYEFLNFINDPDFKVNGDYKATWEFIKQDINSVNRFSNLWLFFKEENNAK